MAHRATGGRARESRLCPYPKRGRRASRVRSDMTRSCAAAIRMILAVLALSGSVLALAACGGPTRSVASYCSYFHDEGNRLRSRWIRAGNSASRDPIGALSSVFGAMPEIAGFMRQLSLRAPREIQPGAEALAESFKHLSEQESSAASDPLGALAGGLVDGLQASGAERRVDAYTQKHCGPAPSSG
jgi:hypothetical protein